MQDSPEKAIEELLDRIAGQVRADQVLDAFLAGGVATYLHLQKAGRFQDHDRTDIELLARAGLLEADAFRQRAIEALDYLATARRWCVSISTRRNN